MSESIQLSIEAQVATITLNRPDRLNSFNPAMHQALKEALDAVLAHEASALVAHLARQPTAGLALIKRAIHAAADNTLDEQLTLERDLQRQAGQAEDYREGVAAFMEKRKPEFKGY